MNQIKQEDWEKRWDAKWTRGEPDTISEKQKDFIRKELSDVRNEMWSEADCHELAWDAYNQGKTEGLNMKVDAKKQIRIIKWALSMFRNEHESDQHPRDKSYSGVALKALKELEKLEHLLQNTELI